MQRALNQTFFFYTTFNPYADLNPTHEVHLFGA
jgi:hypothetical protein